MTQPYSHNINVIRSVWRKLARKKQYKPIWLDDPKYRKHGAKYEIH